MKNDVNIINDFPVDVVRTNAHPVAGILLDPLESEVLETIYSLGDHSKRRARVLCTHAWIFPCPVLYP